MYVLIDREADRDSAATPHPLAMSFAVGGMGTTANGDQETTDDTAKNIKT